MKMTQKIGYALLLSFGIAVSAAADARLEMTADTTTYMYKCGTPANITLQGIDLPETAKTITCTVYVNGKKAEEKTIPANEKYMVTRTLDKPGWLAVVGTVKDANGKVLPKPKPLNAFDRQFKEGIGVLFEPEKIKAASECPADFEAFWNAQKEALKKVPMEVTKTEVEVPDRFKDRTRCYDVKISCAGGMPVSGYLSIPLNAKPKSCPVVVAPHGAGVRSAFLPAWRRNEIRFDFNAHGIENGKDKEYYRNLAKTTLRGYRLKGEGNRETWYFKNMILRALRALEFAKTIPEWDGKNLIVAGESMGGGQAIAASALDPDVTLCQASIPAWGDFNGPASGYPVPKKGEYNTYFDIANFAKLMKCPIMLSTGLIDFTCSPYSIFCAYNALPKDTVKEIRIYPEYGHTGRCSTYPVDFLQFRKPFPKPSGKIIPVPPQKKK